MPTSYDMITILGHTAAGKTRIAALTASALESEVISADSRQVYRDMNIGTGKDIEDYIVDGRAVPVNIIDIRDAGEEYNVFEFQKAFLNCYTRLKKEGKTSVMCGGSGMYIEAVLRNYSLPRVPVNKELRDRLKDKDLAELEMILRGYKDLHNTSDTDTIKRAIRAIEIAEFIKEQANTRPILPSIRSLNIGIAYEREERRARISERLRQRLENGLIEEVEALIDNGITHEKLEYYGLEYKYLSRYLRNELNYEEMYSQLNTAIHQFAKRQMTYFRGMERRGTSIQWIDTKQDHASIVKEILKSFKAI